MSEQLSVTRRTTTERFLRSARTILVLAEDVELHDTFSLVGVNLLAPGVRDAIADEVARNQDQIEQLTVAYGLAQQSPPVEPTAEELGAVEALARRFLFCLPPSEVNNVEA